MPPKQSDGQPAIDQFLAQAPAALTGLAQALNTVQQSQQQLQADLNVQKSGQTRIG